jgi:hypothetical protein
MAQWKGIIAGRDGDFLLIPVFKIQISAEVMAVCVVRKDSAHGIITPFSTLYLILPCMVRIYNGNSKNIAVNFS